MGSLAISPIWKDVSKQKAAAHRRALRELREGVRRGGPGREELLVGLPAGPTRLLVPALPREALDGERADLPHSPHFLNQCGRKFCTKFLRKFKN